MEKLIIKIRKREQLSQSEFADQLGIDQSMLSKLESGRRVPGRKTLQGLAKFCTPDELLEILGERK